MNDYYTQINNNINNELRLLAYATQRTVDIKNELRLLHTKELRI